MRQTEGVVVWDGRRAGPGSAYLVAEPERPAVPEPRRSLASLTDRVRSSLADQPKTTRVLAAELEAATHDVSGALWGLIRRGVVSIQGAKPIDSRVNCGRRFEHVYGLTEGA